MKSNCLQPCHVKQFYVTCPHGHVCLLINAEALMAAGRLQHYLLLEEGGSHGQSSEVEVYFVSVLCLHFVRVLCECQRRFC